tara:strand:- start:91 stop:339 length:249 start_codon:yes stop_codon:yes gene_type:complete
MFKNLPEEEELKLVNGWWYNFKNPPPEWKRPRTKGFTVRLCEICNNVWQSLWNGSVNVEYFKDFPTYGIPRRTCTHCEVDNE